MDNRHKDDGQSSYLVLRILSSIFADKLQFDQLQQFLGIGDTIKDRT
jgi:hypothetical protein